MIAGVCVGSYGEKWRGRTELLGENDFGEDDGIAVDGLRGDVNGEDKCTDTSSPEVLASEVASESPNSCNLTTGSLSSFWVDSCIGTTERNLNDFLISGSAESLSPREA